MLLQIKNLSVNYYRRKKVIPALNKVSLAVEKGEVLGIIGESGCGKTTLALAILRLISPQEGEIVSGQIIFQNKDILKMGEQELLNIRGKAISMIFQNPFTSLNPVFPIGQQIKETMSSHGISEDLEARVFRLLEQVKLPNPGQVMHSYPHQLSGGMQQRAMIAMAISTRPEILIADEPTTALDVTIQKEILQLLKALQEELNISIILITHNLGIVNEFADRIGVIYAGRIIEQTAREKIFSQPLHPYTKGLRNAFPGRGGRLKAIPGEVPDMLNLPQGCKFHPRCPEAVPKCKLEEPELQEVEPNHWVRCYKTVKREA